jgi:hypothetical protein
MTRRYAGAGIAVLSLTLGLASVSGAEDGALQARVQAAYDAQCSDLIGGDFTGFERTLSPSFSASQDGRTITRGDVVMNLKAFTAQGQVTKCTTTIQSVTENSNVVIAVVRQQLDGTLNGGSQGAAGVEIDLGKRDMWSDDRGGLQQTTSVSLWTLTYVNGQLQSQTGTPPSTPPLSVPSPSATP